MAYTITTPTTSTATYTINVGNGASGSVTVPSSYFYSTGAGSTWSSNITSNNSGLHVTSDAEFEGNIKWKGRDLGKMLETIEKRLAILQPNPKKLKKFEALQKAYDHYKLLEALCHSEDDDE